MVKLKKEWQIMIESEAIKKAIKHFECMKNDAIVVLDSGFGTHPGESDLVYRNRKMYAELAINALEKQIPNEPIIDSYCLFTSYTCTVCRHEVELSDYYCRCCGQKIRKTTNNWIGMMKNEV